MAFGLLAGLTIAAIALPWLLGAPGLIALPIGLLAAAMPVTVLILNPDLRPEPAASCS